MKIYLDLCAIQRPLDVANQVRIILESEAVLGIIAICDTGQVELISSEVLVYESELSTFPVRKEHSKAVLSKAKYFVLVTQKERARAEYFVEFGIKPIDALHLAVAETGNADYFCTCDDRLLRSAKQMNYLLVKVVNPIELVEELEK